MDQLPEPAEYRHSSKSIHLSPDAESRLVTIYNKNIETFKSSSDNNSFLGQSKDDLEVQKLVNLQNPKSLLQSAEKPCGYQGMFQDDGASSDASIV